MQYQQVTPGDLTDLEKSIILELWVMKQVDPTFPITRTCLARRVSKQPKEVQAALSHLHKDLHLVGPFVLDPRNIQLTKLGEQLADQLDGDDT